MKKAISILVLMLTLSAMTVSAQQIPDSSKVHAGKIYVITKNDGTQFVGKIVSQDAREVLINTKNIGDVAIPKHEIKQMKEADKGEVTANGDYRPSQVFATRYAISTNGLPIEKGESYILWNLYGPDMQFGVAKNFGVGVMTTWIGAPVIASAKYCIEVDKSTHLALGTLVGSGSWLASKFAIALPFGAITWGNRRSNFTISGGYGNVWNDGSSSGRSVFSIAGMTKVSNKVSLVFDSFIMPGRMNSENSTGNNYFAIYIPAVRIQTESNKAFQFGFAGIQTVNSYTGRLTTSPIPMVQWFRRL